MKKILITLLLTPLLGFCQTTKTLESFGPVYEIENPDYIIDLDQEFKAVFDVASISDYKENPNRKFETVARYLRMHRSPDLENNSVKAVLVVHGSAIYDLLKHNEYAIHHKEKYLQNPNYELLSVLAENDVDIILCGQTLKHRSITKDMLHPDVKIALSAMSVLIQLQDEGYKLINF